MIVRKARADTVPFDNSTNGFAATTVQGAVDELDSQIAPFFGQQFQSAESLGDSSTTSTTVYSTKVTLTPPTSLPTGNYILLYSCVQRTAGANRETDVRIRRGSTTLFEVRTSVIRTQGRFPVSGFVHLSNISGTDAFTLEFKVGGTATTSTVSDARLVLWRVQ